MNEDHRSRAHKFGALRNGTPMVAIGRAGEGHVRGDSPHVGRLKLSDIDGVAQPLDAASSTSLITA